MQAAKFTHIRFWMLVLTCLALLLTPVGALAGNGSSGNWWDVEPEPENPSPFYDSILYSEIAPRLREIEKTSNRVKVEVIGQSAGGRNLFLVTLSDPKAMGRLGQYQAIRNTMLKDPEKAQEMIEKFGDFKVPVFINGSIHGSEYPGTDAAMRLIETLAYEDTPEVRAILDNVILLVNVVQNPDGRVQGTRQNANGFDINRDFITQSQPETRATVKVYTEWNPMVMLDLHGFVDPMLIEPCTPPHNPNYEWDLFIKWALGQAQAMQAELLAQTGFDSQIPFIDIPIGWDDWAPTYAPMFAMYHGAYGHTLETPYRDERGVDAHYAAVWGALKYVADNRQGMINDQIEIFRRGFLDLPQMRVPDEILNQTQWDQFTDLMIQEFPVAYIIPPDDPFQNSDIPVARLVDFLVFNDVQVEQATQAFVAEGVEYPKGSYIVWMDQPKRGLANTILESGPDLSDIAGLTFYSPPSVWSNPLLWGVFRAVVRYEDFSAQSVPVSNADAPKGSVEGNQAGAYAFAPTSLTAFQVTNELIRRGTPVYRSPKPFDDSGSSFDAGMLIVPGDPSLANELANGYALDLVALSGVPASAVQLQQQRIAVYGDEGMRHALRSLGFEFDTLSAANLNAGAIAGYDVFINRDLRWSNLNPAGRAAMSAWFAAGGDFIGHGYRGRSVDFAKDAGIIDVDYALSSANNIVRVDFNPDHQVAAGFQAQDYAFVYYPLWFTRLGAGVEVAASYAAGDFVVSGYWPGWQTSGAAGQPVVVYSASGDTDVTLIGVDNTFRGHPENTFRLLGNAIYSGQD